MSETTVKRVLLTGSPGIGKTTIIKKVCDVLKLNGINIHGFYTEECRDPNNGRTGFDIITLNGQRERLSRNLNSLEKDDPKHFRVGSYYVFPSLFEKMVLPLFTQELGQVLVLDELGKMELLFSKNFQAKVKEAFDQTNVTILGTIPLPSKIAIPLLGSLRNNPSVKIITVNHNNRNSLTNEIVSYLEN